MDTVLETDEKEQLEEKTDFNYNGDEILAEVSEDVTGDESPQKFEWQVDFPKTIYHDKTAFFDVHIPEDADGTLKLFINYKLVGEWPESEWEGGYNTFEIKLPEDMYLSNIWNVTYTGGSRYPATYEQSTFDYKWVEIPEETQLNDNFHIDLYHKYGYLIFLIDGKQVFNDFFNEGAEVSFENLTVGNHNYRIILYNESNELVFNETGTFHADYTFSPNINNEDEKQYS